MKDIVIAFIIIIILFCTFSNVDDGLNNSNQYPTMINKLNLTSLSKPKKWYQCKIDDYGTRILRQILNDNNILRTYEEDWDIILPCNQSYKYNDLKKINVTNPYQIISFMSNSGILGSKERLWKNLLSYYISVFGKYS